MTNELKQEWISILDYPTIYIYGAAKKAEKIYKFVCDMGYKENIKGFLVTDKLDNVEQLCELPVMDIHSFSNKENRILVPHIGVYKEQISSLLESLGFINVFNVGQLRARTIQEEREQAISNREKVGWEVYHSKSEADQEKDAYIRKKIISILQDEKPDFGGVKPYQSLELIGLDGVRPTEYRIREYELRKVLRVEDDILDIGCNSGFLDIAVSGLVHSVTGIEYDGSLVKAANLVKDYLKITNCEFCQGDFNDWYVNVDTRYNVIFSFAIHHWLNISSHEFVGIIDKLLSVHGYLCFESHIYGEDIEYEECYKEFKELGYNIICEKIIKDDGLMERQYVLFQKVKD